MISNNLNSKNNKIIKTFIQEYKATKVPIEVSFRKLLPEIKDIDRVTHLIHPYPAKLLVHIPYLFLNNTLLSKEGDSVLDPFNGSGTVMLESILAKRKSFGIDVNPLANLVSNVKVTKLNINTLEEICKKILRSAKRTKNIESVDVVNCDFWFSKNVNFQLAQIYTAVSKIENKKIRDFFLVSFSNCVKKVSNADQRISVPVKLNPDRFKRGSIEYNLVKNRLLMLDKINVFEKFENIVYDNIKRLSKLNQAVKGKTTYKIISTDARGLFIPPKKIATESIQLIITSPPYAGAQKYIRATSLNLGWTNLATVKDLAILDSKTIGRECLKSREMFLKKTNIKDADLLIEKISMINPTRASIVCTYLNEMKEALYAMFLSLKKNGYLVLIVGNTKVCGYEFNIQEYFSSYLIEIGMKLQFKLIDDIKSYGLMTKRNKTADIISREWILMFKK